MKLLLKDCLYARKHDREMLGIAPGHDRIRRHLLDRDHTALRLHAAEDIQRVAARRREHPCDECLGRRNHGQAVAPPALLDVAVGDRGIGCHFNSARAPARRRDHGLLTSAPTMASRWRCAMLDTSASVLLAIGCSTTTVGCCGMPRTLALIVAAVLNASVMTVTAGHPLFSISIVSWRPHDMQDPQTATPCTMASQDFAIRSITSGGVGTEALNFR